MVFNAQSTVTTYYRGVIDELVSMCEIVKIPCNKIIKSG